MRTENSQAKEPPAPAYAAPAFPVPPLSAREQRAQEIIARWNRKHRALKPGAAPAGESAEQRFDREIRETTLVMTDAEAREYEDAWWVEIERRERLSDLGIVESIPGDVFMKKIKARMKRNARLLAEAGGGG